MQQIMQQTLNVQIQSVRERLLRPPLPFLVYRPFATSVDQAVSFFSAEYPVCLSTNRSCQLITIH